MIPPEEVFLLNSPNRAAPRKIRKRAQQPLLRIE
jgi:hypothetical protein